MTFPSKILCQKHKHHKGSIYCSAWSPMGDLVATGSNDKTIKINRFDIDSLTIDGKEILLLQNFCYTFPKQALVFMCLQYKSFQNTVGKGEIAHNEQFLLFPQCFLPFLEDLLPFSSNLKLSSANSFSLEESEICRLGKSYTLLCCVTCR